MFKIQKLDLLIAIYIFCLCSAEFLGSKSFFLAQIGPIRLTPTVAIFVVPLIFTINDIITEVYGKERTRSIIRSGLLVIFFIFIYSLIAINLPPSGRFQETESAYDSIFGKSARIAFASLTAFAFAEFLDVYIFSKIREKLGKKSLWLRNNASNFVSQLLDTILFMTLAFYAFNLSFGDNIVFLSGLILPYWLLKCFMSVVETPFVYWGVNWLKESKK